ncbi:hypothetical protein SADUNF_Sadunf05G0002700 [Salix dunnii]|uniref:Uncharacterized protein n=1 Tax=Salix dunnii TaxID=1413687 RepID=A0A835K1Q9_9ROSI|nr:hypothetical protein SADUNF_Sadunf05G0002700 [Salix dunnii]
MSPNGQPAKVAWNLKVTENWRDDGSSRPGFMVILFCNCRASPLSLHYHAVIKMCWWLRGRCITVVILLALSTEMVQELKPQLVNLRRQQRELLMKSNDYKNDCTNNILIYRLDSLASSMKSSTNLTSDLGRPYMYCVIGLVFLAVVFVFVTFFRCVFLSAWKWRLVLCFKPNEVLEFLGHG